MGGGTMRAVAKLTGVTVATGGIRGITAEHLSFTSSTRGPFAIRAASTAGSSGEEVKLVSSQSQNPCLEIDDWVYSGGEDKVIMGAGEPMPRVVFDGAPTFQEAKEATSELAVTLEKEYLSPLDSVGYGNSVVTKNDSGSSLSNSQLELDKACTFSEVRMAPALPSPAFKAFRLLHESSAAQNVVASIACDPNVWTAVLQNQELQEFLHSQKTSSAMSDSITGADHMQKLSAESIENSSSDAESEPAKGFVDFVQKIKVTLDDMMNNLSDFFQNLFGGKEEKVSANGVVGTTRLSAENVMEASFLGLAVMAIVVILCKRG